MRDDSTTDLHASAGKARLLEIDHAAIDVDLRYASANNICGRPIYDHALALLHPDAHAALISAAELALTRRLRLVIYDAYRTLAAQWRLWEILPDPRFVADPSLGSTHNRGVAVDLTLADMQGRALDMGTGFDALEARSSHGNTDIPAEAQRNRRLLLELMTETGWEKNPHEWWHYNLPRPERYPVLDDAETTPPLMGD